MEALCKLERGVLSFRSAQTCVGVCFEGATVHKSPWWQGICRKVKL